MTSRSFFIALRSNIKDLLKRIKKFYLPDKFYTREFVAGKYINSIGPKTYGNPLIFDFNDGGSLRIGNYSSIADNVRILLGGNHHMEWGSTYPFEVKNKSFTKGPVVIGNDVYIGMNALILSGVTIGDGAVIGAGAIVTKNVAPYTVVAGNPAKVIRKRFSDPKIKKLLKLKWWNWPEKKIIRNINLLCSENLKPLFNGASKKGH